MTPLTQRFHHHMRLRVLFLSLVALIVVYPFFQGAFLLSVMLSAVLLAALYAVSIHRRDRLIGLCLGLAGLWLLVFLPARSMPVPAQQ